MTYAFSPVAGRTKRRFAGLALTLGWLAAAQGPALPREEGIETPTMEASAQAVLPPAQTDAAMITGAVTPAATALPSAATQADIEALKLAIGHYEAGRIADGDAAAARIGHAAARLAAEAVAVRSGSPAIGFRRIADFLDRYPDWPARAQLERRAEEALLRQRSAHPIALELFAQRAPATPAGRLVHALALDAAGRETDALSVVRALWRDDALTRDLEQRVMSAFGERLTAQDHRDRMEQSLFRGSNESALRSAQRAGADYVKLAQARIALNRKSGGAKAAIEAVPAALRGDSSYIFARAQLLRRQGEAAQAAQLLDTARLDPRASSTATSGGPSGG